MAVEKLQMRQQPNDGLIIIFKAESLSKNTYKKVHYCYEGHSVLTQPTHPTSSPSSNWIKFGL